MVDHEFEPRRLRDRQVGGLVTFKDAARIRACLPKCIGNIRSIADQPADVRVVTASLSGLNQGEVTCIPALADISLIDRRRSRAHSL
jgi:hypothetical protein